jgi:hypothetical protein
MTSEDMNVALIVLLSAVVAALIACLVVMVASKRSQVRRLDSIELRLNEAVPISVAFRAALIKKLTHNHTPEMDELMTRIDLLSPVEEERLTKLLRERVVEYDDPEIDDAERDAAIMLPMMSKRVKSEAMVHTRGLEVQVVLIPAPGSPSDRGKL